MSGFLTGRTSLTSVQTADIADNAITLDKLAHQADGSILTFGTDTAPALLAPDTSGQVLTTKGAGALPAFESSAADVEFVSTVSASGASSVAFESLASGYNYHVTAEGVFLPSGSIIEVTIGTGSTSYQTSGYLGASDGAASNGDGADVTTGTSGMQLNASGYGAWADAAVGAGAINLTVFNVGATATVKPIQCHWAMEVATDGTWYQGFNSSAYGTVGAITAVKFTVSGGTITGQFFLHRTKLS